MTTQNLEALPDNYRVTGQRVTDIFTISRGSCCGKGGNWNKTVFCVPWTQALAVVDSTNRSNEVTDNIFHYESIYGCDKSPVNVTLSSPEQLNNAYITQYEIMGNCLYKSLPQCFKECIAKIGSFDLCDGINAGVIFHEISDERYHFDIQYNELWLGNRHIRFLRYSTMISHAIWRMTAKYNGPVTPFTTVRVMMYPRTELTSSTMDDSLAVALASFMFLPLALQFLFPMYMTDRIQEDKSGLRKYIKMFGVTSYASETVQYIFDYLIYLAVAIFTIIAGVCSGYTFFVHGDPRHYIFLFLIWGHVQISSANALQHIVRVGINNAASKLTLIKYLQCIVFGYAYVLISAVVAAACNVLIFDMNTPPWWYLIHPPFVLYRCFAIIMYQYYANDEYFGGAAFYNSQLMSLYCILLGQIMILQMVGITLREFKDLSFSMSKVISFLFPRIRLPQRSEQTEDDYDVSQERNAIQIDAFATDRDPFLIINDVSKSYNGHKVVDDMHLALDRNECFGLLGTNGAGKTSLISMICGFINPDHGKITLDRCSLAKAHKQNWITICPQFDSLFDNLTVEDHLLFLARLKGFPKEHDHVQEIIKEMGLEEARRRFAKDLSGGMKRRLSIALALTGSPRVVLLDEPTT
jgi:ABC-type transport system involved in cytochrome c biogenesis ATPase subunit